MELRPRMGAAGQRADLVLDLEVMQPLRARVHNGRIVVDEPTDLPEGEVIDLVPLDDVLAAGGDYLDAEARARLHASLDRGLADVEAGRTVDAGEVIATLRARAQTR